MRSNVIVSQPYEIDYPYTLFSKGLKTDVPYVDEKKEFIKFKYLKDTVFVLFYEFKNPLYRRAYVVTCWDNQNDGFPVTLPGIEKKLCLIFLAEGRKVDYLKRTIYYLTKEDEDLPFRLPPAFWYRIGSIIQHSHTLKTDVLEMYRTFIHGDR